MVALNEGLPGGEGERLNALKSVALWNLARLLRQRPGPPAMSPTIYVPVRRGEVLTYEDVVARRV